MIGALLRSDWQSNWGDNLIVITAIGPCLPRGCAFLALDAFSVRLLLATHSNRIRPLCP